MPSNEQLKRVKTYVAGLDDNLNGGIPENSIILIAGPPGSMKSSLGFYILYHNAMKNDKKGVYISLEEGRDSLIDNMAGLGMDWSEVDRKFSILDVGLIRSKISEMGKERWMDVFKMYVKNLRKNLKNDFLVIDSLTVLESLADFDDPRKELFSLFQWLRDLDVTTFLIYETPTESVNFTDAGEGFLSDGILHLDIVRNENTVNLYLGIFKMRKTDHTRDYFPLVYDEKGFEIVIS